MNDELTNLGKSLITLMREAISVGTVSKGAVAVYEIDKVDMSLAASANFLNCPSKPTLPAPFLKSPLTFASTSNFSFLLLASYLREAIR